MPVHANPAGRAEVAEETEEAEAKKEGDTKKETPEEPPKKK